MKSWILDSMKIKGRIYIFPTKMGGYFNGLILLMFLLAIGYSNNLLLIFTLLLFGLNLMWVIQTHFHLYQLQFERAAIGDGHVGEKIPFSIVWKKSPQGPLKWELWLECDKGKLPMHDLLQGPELSQGELTWNERGVWQWRYLKIASNRPFGLYRAWRHLPLQGKSYAYPALLPKTSSPLFKTNSLEGDEASSNRGTGDLRELLPYTGVESRKISWKHYARLGELLVKEGEDLKAGIAELSWTPSHLEKEESLSALATQMVNCHRESLPFSLEIGGRRWGPSLGPRHLAQCLKELSQC